MKSEDGGAELLSLRGVSLCFGSVFALSDIDLSLHRGERVALVGANGSGKTTLLRVLHGLLTGTGRREWRGAAASADGDDTLSRRRWGRDRSRLAGAMVFQRPFFLALSAQTNVSLALWLGGVPRAQRAARTREALARVGLLDRAADAAHHLSGGQQQRLALARAWALKPDLLFLDEPTASLDPGAKREIESLIASLGDDGLTLVMSTHNLGQAKRLATRVVCLDAGRVVADLPVERFFQGDLPAAAAQFLRAEVDWT